MKILGFILISPALVLFIICMFLVIKDIFFEKDPERRIISIIFVSTMVGLILLLN